MTLYCPRCDKRLTPDHCCVSRRIFIGALLGATIVPAAIATQGTSVADVVAAQMEAVRPLIKYYFEHGLWAGVTIEQKMTKAELLERYPEVAM